MSLDRRTFFKAFGAAGVALALGKTAEAAQAGDSDTEFMGVLYDASRCVGCQTCEFSCADSHSMEFPEDEPDFGIKRRLDHTTRTVVNWHELPDGGEGYSKQQCMHCNEPACFTACLTRALYKTKEGPVVWREDKCMGCRFCMISCPFDIPKTEYGSTNPRIIKCNMCYHTWEDGGTPACANDCPYDALMFGTRRELLDEARRRMLENPDTYYNHIYGEKEAGGTCWLVISPVPVNEIGFNNKLQNKSYPGLTKGFVSSIAPVDLLLPAFLLGVYEATKVRTKNMEEEE
jgi:formate dehydrogenase iron-sulfur subunit